MTITSIGNIYEGINKESSKRTFYDDLSRGGRFIFKSQFGDTFVIKINGLQIKNESRPSFIEISHNIGEKSHNVSLVLDYKHNYKKSEEPHLNFTDPSEKTLEFCETCKKYFEGLNHKFAFTMSNTTDADMLWEQIKKHLKEKSFFNEYKLI